MTLNNHLNHFLAQINKIGFVVCFSGVPNAGRKEKRICIEFPSLAE